MSRKKREYKRVLKPDSRYQNIQVGRFINKVMIQGKKSIAERIVYDALEALAANTGKPPADAFESVLKNVAPLMEVKSRRVGGSTYQVPVEVKRNRAYALAMRWIIANSQSRSGRSMTEKLAQEMTDAFNNSGASIKKREDTHKMAEANKAFAHFRW